VQDCAPGLSCVPKGLGGACEEPGTADVLQPCEGNADCIAGLVCHSGNGTCTHPGLLLADLLAPRACEEVGGEPRFLFEVPRGGEAASEFYRLPFPNDIRAPGGRIDLSGHPTLPVSLLGMDPVKAYVDAIEARSEGFSTVAPILFRASEPFSGGGVKALASDAGGEDVDTLMFVDVTPGSPDYGKRLGLNWQNRTGGGSGTRYICTDWLAVRPPFGRPLRANTTYAVMLAEGIESDAGVPMGRDADFEAMLSGSAPTGADLAKAWSAYAPLRAFLADPTVERPVDGARLLTAAVFTTGDPTATLSALRDATDSAAPPAPEAITLCAGGAKSPCDDGLSGEEHVRGCFAESADFYELHGKVSVPIYQEGAPPYLDEGGAVGKIPTVVRSESVCFALSIPKSAAMPAGGWPLVLYAHGTGGNFRSPMANGFAQNLATASADGTPAPHAVLSWEQVQHGPRRGDSALDPDVLFFNFANPDAALGNSLQGAADGFQMERLALAFDVEAAASPTGQAIRFDAARLVFAGHSQGATTGVPYAALSKRVGSVLLSGAGGGLTLSLLEKSSPVDIASGLPLALGDQDGDGNLTGGTMHPVLGLLQHYFLPVEPLGFGLAMFREPPPGVTAKHVLHLWGIGDTYVPDSASSALAGALRTVQATPELLDIPGASLAEPPFEAKPGPVTAATSQHQPGDYDGHFVLFQNAGAALRAASFFASGAAAEDGVPTIVP
jgi:predicted esterase